MRQLFETGGIVSTWGALDLMKSAMVNPKDLLKRHVSGDWGELSDDDKAENQFSIEHGYRILSAYNVKGGRIWIITEADRSVTTFLLPDEY